MSKCDLEFEKFYKTSEYHRWRPEEGILSKKTVLWQVWSKAWQEAYKEGREELAASLVRDLHGHMGKKKIVTIDY